MADGCENTSNLESERDSRRKIKRDSRDACDSSIEKFSSPVDAQRFAQHISERSELLKQISTIGARNEERAVLKALLNKMKEEL